MITNLKIRKKLMQLGITAVAAVNGVMCLGCTSVEAKEEVEAPIAPIVEVEDNEPVATRVPKTSSLLQTPTFPHRTPTPEPTLEITPKPTEKPYNPYDLTDEEAIEMGTYIYDNYISKYTRHSETNFSEYADYMKKEDVINLVCVFNQKYPTLYTDRESACRNGDIFWVNYFPILVLNANRYFSLLEHQNNLFPFSTFMKEGRPERELLEELEANFRYLTDNKVSNEEIYGYWGKVIKMAINSEETFKDWDPINYYLFYYTVRSQAYFMMFCPDVFNNLRQFIPASYVFNTNKKAELILDDLFFMRDTVDRNRYSNLTDEEFNAYVGCCEEYYDKCLIYNQENNYIKQRIKDGN